MAFQQQAGMINRTTIIQNLIEQKQAKIYLEIGVSTGNNFLQIRADKKMAVDPQFKIPGGYASDESTNYYEITSDDFFVTQSDILETNGLDVVFVDGLHTYEQSLKDVLNSLEYLNEGGIILMHDCNPSSKASAHPVLSEARQMPGFNNAWMGDVWKAIVYLRSLRSDLSVFVLDCDCGVGIVQKKSPESMLNYSQEAIDNLSYEDLEADRANLLNLKKPDYSIE
ncbi:MAG: class I SAM-dependent methyltransferase [Crocosphaera sp.]|nr:class I SAM-dependent methyltransferase [Crocosphaera sp.]